MRRETCFALILITGTMISGGWAATIIQQDRLPKQVTRAKRPTFTERDWDGVFYENLFTEGLVGSRPAKAIPGSTPATIIADNESGTPDKAVAGWSELVSGSTLEDEVKSLQGSLAIDITTPVKFKSDYSKAHQSFSMLSMLFAIIREYDGDVRWKKFADPAQVSFERAAANSRVGTIQAYESCKRRKADLEEMVRGGNFAGDEKAPETLDWSIVIDRSPIMKRLEESAAKLKLLSANQNEFSNEIETVFHESELVAAMAQVLMKEDMTDADDDGYQSLAKAMLKAATETREACKNQDYESAARAINMMAQSCNNCHEDWK